MEMQNKLNMSVVGTKEIERLILILNVGLMMAMKKGILSIEDVESLLYSPYSVEKLENLGIKKEVSILVSLGCELEDVESLFPQNLEKVIDEIKDKSIELLRVTSSTDGETKKWID